MLATPFLLHLGQAPPKAVTLGGPFVCPRACKVPSLGLNRVPNSLSISRTLDSFFFFTFSRQNLYSGLCPVCAGKV